MFYERPHNYQRSGWIEVICGSMFSGKTEELIRRMKRALIAKSEGEKQQQINVADGKVMVDGANVVKTDIKASNGVIHVIDTVILPRN